MELMLIMLIIRSVFDLQGFDSNRFFVVIASVHVAQRERREAERINPRILKFAQIIIFLFVIELLWLLSGKDYDVAGDLINAFRFQLHF